MADETTVPKTALWRVEGGDLIVLECECGMAVEYPGHPDDRTEVACRECGHVWKIEP